MNTAITLDGSRFKINKKLTYSEYSDCPEKNLGLLMNARFIQGIFDDAEDVRRFDRFGKVFNPDRNTDSLIAALPKWYEYGLRAFTVGLQGGGPCFTTDSMTIRNTPYSETGELVDGDYLNRLRKLIKSADQIGMVVIVSLFYGPQSRFLKDDMAVERAVSGVCHWLICEKFTNVILEIANEHDLDAFRIHPILHEDEGIVRLIDLVHREAPGILVGCSNTGAYFSEQVAKASDVVLIHGNNMTRQKFYYHIECAKRLNLSRPIVCNEDSQALSNMQVALNEGVSWGYYNNMTKQEPPTDWSITEGEDSFFADRMACSFGIKNVVMPMEQCFDLQGLGRNEMVDGKAWIRLSSLYPEKIDRVDFYRDGSLYTRAYDDPFTVNFVFNWIQKPVTGLRFGEKWQAEVFLSDGSRITKKAVVGQINE